MLFSPGWLLRHALALSLVVFFVYMGRWQWTKGESSHGTLQNLFYGIEWWIFTAFVLYLWGKMIIEEIRPTAPKLADGDSEAAAEVAEQPTSVVLASLAASPPDDEDPDDAELAEYNRYLAALRERDRV
ncbi:MULTISPECIES: hypothetical protein [unclassified Pseudofrankia]|uniref:hypothetical protein n=1 Tax=unclassified Pseudofrankia TaxID=2994372 RepID=UPI000ACB4F1E|nr:MULTISPECIES: hypothetical protein [unclassified Pseudofrankia]MDT3441817.1 hypothetical protein [Pseudofrankia sp. BMG5.37]